MLETYQQERDRLLDTLRIERTYRERAEGELERVRSALSDYLPERGTAFRVYCLMHDCGEWKEKLAAAEQAIRETAQPDEEGWTLCTKERPETWVGQL